MYNIAISSSAQGRIVEVDSRDMAMAEIEKMCRGREISIFAIVNAATDKSPHVLPSQN
jgi:hypothetical protein